MGDRMTVFAYIARSTEAKEHKSIFWEKDSGFFN